MINYADILIHNYVGKKWGINGFDYSGIIWSDESPKPTQAEMDALWESTQAQAQAKEQAEIDAKASALAKLTALGLTADEVKALLGA